MIIHPDAKPKVRPLEPVPAGEVVVAAPFGVALERWMPVFM